LTVAGVFLLQGEPRDRYAGICGWFVHVGERISSFFSAVVRTVRDLIFGV
jgi:hypothetical protein